MRAWTQDKLWGLGDRHPGGLQGGPARLMLVIEGRSRINNKETGFVKINITVKLFVFIQNISIDDFSKQERTCRNYHKGI